MAEQSLANLYSTKSEKAHTHSGTDITSVVANATNATNALHADSASNADQATNAAYAVNAGSVPFSGITGKPTTASGYGITNVSLLGHTHSGTDITSKVALADMALTAGKCTGNSDTASKLQLPVKINGVSFDGSADITVQAPDASKLPLAGGTITGDLTINGTLTAPNLVAAAATMVKNIPTSDIGGNIWVADSTGGTVESPAIIASLTAPSNPVYAQLWFDISTGLIKAWGNNAWYAFSGKQSVYYSKTSSTMQTITSTTPVVVTGLSVTLTPRSVDSKFLIMAVVNGSLTYVCSSSIFKNGVSMNAAVGNNGSYGAAGVTTYYNGNTATMALQHNLFCVDVPATTSAITYDVRHNSTWSGAAYATYVNNRSGNDMCSPSTFVVIEL